MKSFVRSVGIVALATAATLIFNTAGAEVIYQLTNNSSVQNGFTLSGSITTNGTLGVISASDITKWSFSFTNGITTQSNSSATDALFLSDSLLASSTNLFLPQSKYLQLGALPTVYWNNDGSILRAYEAAIPIGIGGSMSVWRYDGTSMLSVGTSWVIASISPVPEIDPATGGSALSLVAGVLAMIEQRRRRAIAVA